MTDRSHWPVKKFRLGEEPPDEVLSMTPQERLEMMWQLAINAWGFVGVSTDEREFRRDVVRTTRGGS